jgi:glycosyltransferase involved in cell wall biosynthesis
MTLNVDKSSTLSVTSHLTQLYFTVRTAETAGDVRSGGIRQVLNYAPHWQKHGIQFHLCIPCGKDETPGEESIADVLWHRFTPGSQLGPGSPGHDEAMHLALSLIDSDPQGSALIMPSDLGPGTARLLDEARSRGIASLLPVHMYPAPCRPYHPKDWLRRQRERRWYSPITALHANSEVSARAMASLAGRPLSWTKVIATGVDLGRFRPPVSPAERTSLRERLNIPHDRFVALFMGGTTERKGVEFLVDAWAHFAETHKIDATLLLVGDAHRPGVAISQKAAYRSFSARFQRKIASLPPACDVRLIPHSPAAEEWYRAADVFTLASFHEGLPNAVLEAMATGLPVVSARFRGFPHEGGEFGFEGQHFISPARCVSAWSDALAGLAADPQRRLALGSAARRWMACYQDINVITAQSAEFMHAVARSVVGRR